MSQAAVEHAPEHYRSTSLPDPKLMMWIFLASDCMFFGTLIGTYLVYKNRSLEGPFPVDVLDIPITTVSSFVLLMSSFLMVLALHALRTDNIPRFRLWTFGVAFFGSVFLGFQVFEFSTFVKEGLTLQQNLFGTTFFTLTGTHGIHVTIGVLWMLSILITSYVRPMSSKDALYLEVAGLYWHFVDIVWIVIFTVIYLVEFV
ncbi:MAG: cytochrome c oxidase subunit 3 [Trueperaceae bacterium]|nr:MAG: cytochrome c oxidase subunit 3 [Trueperaceae bacterium]